MIEDSSSPDIDHNLYSRQIGTFGVEAMGKLIKLRVLIQGMAGIGLETAKNLILAGPKSVTIHDTSIVTKPDLGANFYARESDVGHKTRAQASLSELKELNPYVQVDIHDGPITTDFVSNFDVVVFTDSVDRDHLIEINEFCRKQKTPIGFIWTGSLGLYGWTFVDFGPSHNVFDHNGENCLSTIITSISRCPKGIVTVNDDKRHGFEDDDYVTFREVEGMTEVNEKTFKIKVISPFSFEIGDTSSFGEYTRQGIAEQVKVPRQVKFYSLARSLEEPLGKNILELQDPDMDWENMNKPFELHVVLKSVLDFYAAKKRLPELLSEEDATALAGIAHHKVEELKKASAEWDNDSNKPEGAKKPSLHRVESIPAGVAENIAKFARTQTPPFNSFWGGIVAQEVVKFTGKFSPLRQWLHYSVFNTCMPDGEVERTVDNEDRFRDTVVLFGKQAAQKLKDLKLYMIGAGALGCEYLKQFALMGVASSAHGKLTVTDDDSIEISNLNRQFLFRKKHVGSSKAATACSVAKTINPHLNVEAKIMRADPKSENVFTDQFWDDLDCVFGAVDNIHARQYVDSKCVLHKKYLFESGTLGTKCNSQIVVPYKTQSYNDSQDQKEESIPMCTLRNYPYLLDHTIEWSRDYFQGLWANGSADFKSLIENPAGFVKTTIEESKNQAGSILDKFTFLSKFTICWPTPSTKSFVALARQIFQDIFHDQIAQLLYCFPRDYKDDKGNLFWSSPKRPPYVIDFDAEDEMHFLFIKSAVTILSSLFNVKVSESDDALKELAKNAPYVVAPVKKKVIKTNDTDTTAEKGEDDDEKLHKLIEMLSSLKADPKAELNLVEFEKDDDSNGHIDFMTAVANLRARNYKIQEAPRHKIKIIAGKIIPAIATTTAMIVGACGLELYKYVLGKDASKFRNSFMNLALPLWVFSEPLPAIVNKDVEYDPIAMAAVKAIPPNWTSWQTVDIQGPNKTIQQIIDFLGETYGVETTMLISGTKPLWASYMDHDDRLGKTLEEVYKTTNNHEGDFPEGMKYLIFVAACNVKDSDDEASLPHIRYILH